MHDRDPAMIDHIYLLVSDLNRASEFYKKVIAGQPADSSVQCDDSKEFGTNDRQQFRDRDNRCKSDGWHW